MSARPAEREVRELLRQARVHVVEVRHPQQRGEHDADEPAFFVRVDGVVAPGEGAPERGQRRAARRAGASRATARSSRGARTAAAAQRNTRRPGIVDVLAERIGDEIDLMAERGQRADAMKLAERRAARLEERLGRDHQNAHGAVIFSRIRQYSTRRSSCECPTDPPDSSSARRYASSRSSSSVSIVLLAFLFSRIDVGGAVGERAQRVDAVARSSRSGLYFVNVRRERLAVAAAARGAGRARAGARRCSASYLVAGFFNNFLPSNIGGDVIRIRDTARPARSKTLATTVVLVDRGLGLMGLVLVAALGATAAPVDARPGAVADLAAVAVGRRFSSAAAAARAGGVSRRRVRPAAAAADCRFIPSGSASGSRS